MKKKGGEEFAGGDYMKHDLQNDCANWFPTI